MSKVKETKESNTEFDIFNLSLEDLKTEEQERAFKNYYYKTDPKQSKDSIYRSVIRFLPNPKDIKKSFLKKYTYWLEGIDGKGFFIDCPTSVPGERSILYDTFWKLYKSDSAYDKKQSDLLKRKEYYYSYIYVVKDPQQPDLENTVQIFRYPKAIKKLIDAQISPDTADIDLGSEPCKVNDFMTGKDFSLKVTLKGTFWNYDECRFSPNISSLKINGVPLKNDKSSRELAMSLYDGIIDLNEFEFKPWSEEDREKVNKFLSDLTGGKVGNDYTKVTTKQTTSNRPVKSSQRVEEEDFELDTNANSDIKPNTKFDIDIEDVDEGMSEIDEWLKEDKS